MADTGDRDLKRMIASLQQFSWLPAAVAPDVADVIDADIQRTIRAGTTSEGVPWELTQKGDKPLKHAAGAVFVSAIGATIYVGVAGIEARHHTGRVNGERVRSIIPISTQVPDRMAAEITKVLDAEFREIAGG